MSNMTNTFDKQTAKFLAMVAQSMPELSGDAMQEWIESPRALQRALYGSLFLPMQPTTPGEFKTWKMLTLKAYKDARQILMAFALIASKAFRPQQTICCFGKVSRRHVH